MYRRNKYNIIQEIQYKHKKTRTFGAVAYQAMTQGIPTHIQIYQRMSTENQKGLNACTIILNKMSLRQTHTRNESINWGFGKRRREEKEKRVSRRWRRIW